MNKKSIISIIITFSVGLIFEMIPKTFDDKPSELFDYLLHLFKSGIIMLIIISIIPLIISLIIMFKEKSFPNKTFTKINYIFLIIITTLAIIGLF